MIVGINVREIRDFQKPRKVKPTESSHWCYLPEKSLLENNIFMFGENKELDYSYLEVD